MDLSELSHDVLVEHIAAGIREAETRLVASGEHPRALKLVKIAHNALDIAAEHMIARDIISADSVGGDKP